MENRHPDVFKKVMGKHYLTTRHAALHLPDQPYNKTRTASAWKIEEKLTDVNLANSLLPDCVPTCKKPALKPGH